MMSSTWLTLVPYVLILGIFYFVILLPMRKKQQKVDEFLKNLKAGDRVITTGGIYGQITKLNESSVQLQIAEKIRIEVAKAAIGGLPGTAAGRGAFGVGMQNLRWKIITCVAVFIIFAGVGVYPLIAGRYGITSPKWLIDRQLKLGLDLQGGVHLVLRVQTDDALRHETEAESERLREALEDRGHYRRRQHHRRLADPVQDRGDCARAGRRLPAGGGHGRDQLRPQPRRRRRLYLHHAPQRRVDAA